MEWLPAYLALGLATGVIAGLLGVGGGLVMVPALTWAFAQQGFPAGFNIHMALGTSLAVIIPTSISSMRAHHAHGAVDWSVVRRITPGILLGTLLGGGVAVLLPDRGLRLFFIAFLLYAATQMLLGLKPRPTRGLPGPAGMTFAGGVIGLVSSWVGIGGGTMSVPFQTWCNVGLHRAIGTSAAIGLPIAVSGMLAYMLSGQAASGLPPWSLGFVYLPAFLAIAAGSGLTAPLGARWAHRLPVARLKKAFATLLYLLALRMAYSVWAP
ncbi:MAG: sulfite exporter TauE/SafE family protein [Pseudomonadota bacterium]